ncbi:MAG: Ppx/GppA family phosphatase [Eggerthellaceae bacterium]|nr:Ppx/GppA family phosphatase [Eggerthellaceae bacterium]
MHTQIDPISETRPSARYAAIDIGTVTSRLLVADIDAAGLHEREKDHAITNLGEGVDATGYLKRQAMERVAAQIAVFQKKIAAHQDSEHPKITTITTATSASRDAKNAAEFLAILQNLGIELTIIPGEKEAKLAFLGVSNSFPKECLLVVDIGGGSTEISAGCTGELPRLSCSIDVGCRRVTERFLRSDPPGEEELHEARLWIRSMMGGCFEKLSKSGFSMDRMVAVAGTATSAVSIHKKMEVYDSRLVHGSVLERSDILAIYERLRHLPLEARRQTLGLDPDRADVIVAGLEILLIILDLAGRESVTVSESDILQGIILDTAAK